MTKVCNKCGVDKPLTEFGISKGNKYGVRAQCKLCRAAEWSQYNKEHPNKCKAVSERYRKNHPDKCKETKRKCYLKQLDKNREYAKTYQRNRSKEERDRDRAKWKKLNPTKVKEQYTRANRKRTTILENRLSHAFGSGMYHALKLGKAGRHWESLVGYTISQLKQHLESKFLPGMSWNNYGKYGWHIDHIIPVDFFEFKDYTDVEFQYCWSLGNLQPMWAADNIRKSNKLPMGIAA